MVSMAARRWSHRRGNIARQLSAILTTLSRRESSSCSLGRFYPLCPLPSMLSVSAPSPWIVFAMALPCCSTMPPPSQKYRHLYLCLHLLTVLVKVTQLLLFLISISVPLEFHLELSSLVHMPVGFRFDANFRRWKWNQLFSDHSSALNQRT